MRRNPPHLKKIPQPSATESTSDGTIPAVLGEATVVLPRLKESKRKDTKGGTHRG